MKLATVRIDGQLHPARVEGDDVVLLSDENLEQVLSRPGADGPAETGQVLSRSAVEFAPPVTRPNKILCVGLNYLSHLQEIGIPRPKHPALFTKFASTLIGAEDPIELPSVGAEPMWEVELVIVMGRPLSRGSVTPEIALGAVGGYTVANDVTMRDFQRHTSQWLPGKAFDRTTPIGPVIVTPEEIDHARDLELRCEVDGETRQFGSTTELLFDPAQIIGYITQFAALHPGDLILTGTPAGSSPETGNFLRPGQLMRSWIAGIGECRNLMVSGS
jgi:acylpyruvate hydrolase